MDARKDPDGAMATLKEALGKYPDYTPDIYHAMAMVTEKMIQRAGGKKAPKSLLKQKLDYLLKAKSELDAGKTWTFDPMHNRTSHLDMSIKQAEKEAR